MNSLFDGFNERVWKNTTCIVGISATDHFAEFFESLTTLAPDFSCQCLGTVEDLSAFIKSLGEDLYKLRGVFIDSTVTREEVLILCEAHPNVRVWGVHFHSPELWWRLNHIDGNHRISLGLTRPLIRGWVKWYSNDEGGDARFIQEISDLLR
jgi:hypothetical protein